MAYALVETLAGGAELGTACQKSGLPEPPLGPNLQLNEDEYTVPPVCYFLPAVFWVLSDPAARGRSSPSEDAGCYCLRIASTNKLDFLREIDSPDLVLKWLATALEAQTGIGFTREGADAFRGFEVFECPSLGGNERSLVEVERDDGAMSVVLRVAESGTRYLVQLRTTLTNDVVFDEALEATGSPPAATFLVPDPVDGVAVKVWRRLPSEKRWVLWHEHETHYVRAITTNMRISGLSGEVHSGWLDRLKKSRVASRAEALQKVQQVSSTVSTVSSREPWEAATLKARATMRRLLPERSSARFFPKGWEGESRIEFAEWLRAELSRDGYNVLLLDPYFDTPGLGLMCTASGAANEIAILTCTQAASKDDNSVSGAVSRNVRLSRACEQLAPLLRGLGLKVLDLRSLGGSSKQLFHDRYLLFYDRDGRVERGFALSTSIQAATRTDPLLITPIPLDTLDAVSDYASALLASDGATQSVEQLYPPTRAVATPKIDGIAGPEAALILRYISVVQAHPEYAQVEESRANDLIREMGILRDGRLSIGWNEEHGHALAGFLKQASLAEFSEVWCGVSEMLARSLVPDELVKGLTSLEGEPLRHLLSAYLSAVPQGQVRVGRPKSRDSGGRGLAYAFRKDFSDALDLAARTLDHHHDLLAGATWAIHYAMRILVEHWPEAFDEAAQSLLRQGDTADETLTAFASAAATPVQLGDRKVIEQFASARTPFLRALSAVATWRAARRDVALLPGFFDYVIERPVDERRAILARAIYDLRVEANRGQQTVEHNDILSQVFKHLLGTFDSPVSDDELLQLVPALSGPLIGSWSSSTNDELLLPLCRQGLLSGDRVFGVWDQILERRFSSEDRHFFASTDEGLLQTWARGFWLASAPTQAGVFRRCAEETKKASRALAEPFLRSRDYRRWRRSADDVLWWLLRLGAIEGERPSGVTIETVREAAQQVSDVVGRVDLIESAVGELGESARRARALLEAGEAPDAPTD